MPREPFEIPDPVETLSILGPDGGLDKDLEPDLDDELLIKLYRFMLLGRRFDERMLNLQRQGRIGTFPPVSGQEASQLGPVAMIEDEDWMVPSFRETAVELWRGRSMESILISANGYAEGAALAGKANNMPVSVPVGSQMLHAVGIAWAMKYRGRPEVAVTYFGDGATSEGDFHEAMNFAAVYAAPVIFVCQNNQWAISVPRSKQTRSKSIAQKAVAYGMPGIQVDGNDILAMVAASKEAVERARSGKGPTLIEAVTYRMSVHTTADDPKRYRTDEEVDSWRDKDPLTRFGRYLSAKKRLDAEKIDAMEGEVKSEIQAAVDGFEEKVKSMGDPMDMFDHVYDRLPPYLKEQRKALARELSQEQSHG